MEEKNLDYFKTQDYADMLSNNIEKISSLLNHNLHSNVMEFTEDDTNIIKEVIDETLSELKQMFKESDTCVYIENVLHDMNDKLIDRYDINYAMMYLYILQKIKHDGTIVNIVNYYKEITEWFGYKSMYDRLYVGFWYCVDDIHDEIKSTPMVDQRSYYSLERLSDWGCLTFVKDDVNELYNVDCVNYINDRSMKKCISLDSLTHKFYECYVRFDTLAFRRFFVTSMRAITSGYYDGGRYGTYNVFMNMSGDVPTRELNDILTNVDDFFNKIQKENVRKAIKYHNIFKRVGEEGISYPELHQLIISLKSDVEITPAIEGLDEIVDNYNAKFVPYVEGPEEENVTDNKEIICDKDGKKYVIERITDDKLLMSDEYVATFIKCSGLMDILKNVIIMYNHLELGTAKNKTFTYCDTSLDNVSYKLAVDVDEKFGYSIPICIDLENIMMILA